ncbi:hypothetical protein B0H19DRAFT_1201310 [Mycena capillaripes]|nr:hypothetical protein B0H19DRAFT_1201310 [Mycena capillaripes]
MGECSVRGCSNPLEPPAPYALKNNKMCAACREKHRGYASTKRARRRAEKTLVSKLTSTAVNIRDVSAAPPVNRELPVAQYTSGPVPWAAIDPALYAQPSASSSSTLAGALTLQPATKTPATPAASSTLARPNEHADLLQSAPPYTESYRSTAPHTNVAAPVTPQPAAEPAATVEAIPQASGSRFCSVKGCKAIILESTEEYPFKMCQPCRSRYRNYGITKRAKWKTEREAFQRELDGLRAKEDARRAANGLPPLADGTDELQAWELSIIDEQVPYPPGHQSGNASGSMNSHVPPPPPLPARVCTVSHCHNLLPGLYRYKRCETHRIQNRWHSKLKRGREKIEKGFMLPDGTLLVAPGPIKIKRNEVPKEPKEKKTRKKREARDKDKDGQSVEEAAELSNSENLEESEAADVPLASDDTPDKPIPRRSRSAYSCREDGCCNLIIPGTRWRSCESCRAVSKAQRQGKRAAEREQRDGPFVNMNIRVDPSIPSAGATASHSSSDSASIPGTSTAPIDVSTRSAVVTGAAATYPPGHTLTSTLLTVNEPPPDKSSETASGVRRVRKYNKLPRYDKDGNMIIPGASTNNSTTPSTAPNLIPALHTSAYPYIPPPPGYPYYMPPPGYYSMPPPGSAAPGLPPFMYIPSPYPYPVMPPSDKSGTTPATPALPYPYYPYPVPPPGYGLPSHYPRANYVYPTGAPPVPAGGHQSPYTAYKVHSTPVATPPPSAAGSSQGYSYYQFKNSMKNPAEQPAEEQPNKRRRLSEEGTVIQTPGRQTPPQGETPAAVPPTDAPAAPEQPIVMDVDVPDEEQRPSAPEAPSQRPCGSKTCNRVVPAGASGFCEKCRTKMKRRQAMTKQRFKLEPRKITVMKSG